MSRATNAPASRERRRKRLELAKGFRGRRSKTFRTATEAVDRARRLATIHRKLKKRDFRQLWIARINAATRAEGMSYSRHDQPQDAQRDRDPRPRGLQADRRDREEGVSPPRGIDQQPAAGARRLLFVFPN